MDGYPAKISRSNPPAGCVIRILSITYFSKAISLVQYFFLPAGGFFEKFTINHLTSPKPTTALSNRKILSSFLVAQRSNPLFKQWFLLPAPIPPLFGVLMECQAHIFCEPLMVV